MLQHSLSRTELLIGSEALNNLKNKKVVVFGIGGVGGSAAEALARSGIGTMVLVDNDTVSVSNINRQIIALYSTIGRPKVEVMKERIEDINKQCTVITHETYVTADNIGDIVTDDVDYVVDAIDTVSSKIALAVWCEEHDIRLISSMGTGNKLDPTMFKVDDIYKTKVCPLAKVMRRELKRRGVKKLKVLYSEEQPLKPMSKEEASKLEINPMVEHFEEKASLKRQTPGSMPFVPPVAGMIIAGTVIKELMKISE